VFCSGDRESIVSSALFGSANAGVGISGATSLLGNGTSSRPLEEALCPKCPNDAIEGSDC